MKTMLQSSTRLLKIAPLVLIITNLIFSFSCANPHSQSTIIHSKKKPEPSEVIISKNIGKQLEITVKYDSLNHKNIIISQANGRQHIINLPNQNEYNGFSLNWVKKTKEGFELSVEYGSSLYYDVLFNFHLVNDQLVLVQQKIYSFNKANPEEAEFSDTAFKNPIPIKEFSIKKFLP